MEGLQISISSKNTITNLRENGFNSVFIVASNVIGALDRPKGIITNS